MSKKLYIADCHFGHSNLNNLMDNRGFSSVEEMNDYMIVQWNKAVHAGDEVYILGDFIWRYPVDKLPELFNILHGKKFLIRGNHDDRWLNNFDNERHHAFNWIKDYAEIHDNRRTVILCHYPIISYNHQFSENAWMLHGHIHVTKDVEYVEQYKSSLAHDVRAKPYPNLINCFCMFSNYMPLTLDEWIEKEKNGEAIPERLK